MAYEPINWQAGDIITSARLNQMDNGWDVAETELFSETITTVDHGHGEIFVQLAYSHAIDADTITVVFDDVEYICPRIDVSNGYYYGSSISELGSSSYPFHIFITSAAGNGLYTETAGEHTITVSVLVLQTSADFDKARGYGYVTSSPTELFNETVTTADNGNGFYTATFTYSGIIDTDAITVTFDDVEYTCPRIGFNSASYYGGFTSSGSSVGSDFTNYPFIIESTNSANTVITETTGTHTIAVTTVANTSMETSADFVEAVGKVSSMVVHATVDETYQWTIYDATAGEIWEALSVGKNVVIITDGHEEDSEEGTLLITDILPIIHSNYTINTNNSEQYYNFITSDRNFSATFLSEHPKSAGK